MTTTKRSPQPTHQQSQSSIGASPVKTANPKALDQVSTQTSLLSDVSTTNRRPPSVDTAILSGTLTDDPAFTRPHVGTSQPLLVQAKTAPPSTVVVQTKQQSAYASLLEHLAELATHSGQSRQQLYIDLWTGQHWLGLSLTDHNRSGILVPISPDTAESLSKTGDYTAFVSQS